MYKDEYHPQVKKDLKALDHAAVRKIQSEYLDIILKDPLKYERLSGNLSGIYSYHFKITKTEYRICYIINEVEKIVTILMIGKRENFYDILKRRVS